MRTILNSLRIILSIRNTININAILNGIRHLPIIGKHIPERIYGVRAIKIITLVFSLQIEIIKAFFGKLGMFALLALISFPIGSYFEGTSSTAFLYGLVILSLFIAMFSNVFAITAEAKYAVFHLGMDAKEYILAILTYQSVNTLIGYTFFGIPAALLLKVPWFLIPVIPLAGVGLLLGRCGFMMLFYAARSRLNDSMEGEGTYFGEVDGSDMANVEESEQFREKTHGLAFSYIQPWSSDEYKTLRYPLLAGFVAALLFVLWICLKLPFFRTPYENVEVTLVNVLPLVYPVIAFVAAVALVCKALWIDKSLEVGRRFYVALTAGLALLAALAGAFYAGGASETPAGSFASAPLNVYNPADSAHMEFVWKARCAQCHGVDGRFNEKFVREFYPVPQKLDASRIDSLGVDSLVKVVLEGRVNMNAYRGRLTESEARGLVMYMRSLAGAPDEPDSAGEAP